MFVWLPDGVNNNITGWGLTCPNTVGNTITSVVPGALASSYLRNTPLVAALSSASGTTDAGIPFNSNSQAFWRGNAAGLGGFDLYFRFGHFTSVASHRCFVGLAAATLNLTSNPSAALNIVAIAKDAADTTYQVMTNDGTGTATKTDTTVTVAIDTLYEVHISCSPNGSSFTVTLSTITGSGKTVGYTGSFSSDLPAAATVLGPVMLVNAAAAAGNMYMAVQQVAGTWQ
jgi:hypothetical protein